MNILAIDDEELALALLESEIREALPDAEVYIFRKTEELLAHAAALGGDVAFLDIELGGMNGIELARRLKEVCPRINIIFVTGYADYSGDAFQLHASGYVLKPPTKEAILMEMENLRYPPERKMARVRIQTFGHFEVFVDDQPVVFSRSKAKEMLAYLIDRQGAAVTGAEMAAVLLEDANSENEKGYVRLLLHEMLKSLKTAGAERIIRRQHKTVQIDSTQVDCDYYRFLAGDVEAINRFHGEYMSNYAWAEFTTGFLCEQRG